MDKAKEEAIRNAAKPRKPRRRVRATPPCKPWEPPPGGWKTPNADKAAKLAAALERSADHDSPEEKRRVMFSVARSLYEQGAEDSLRRAKEGNCHDVDDCQYPECGCPISFKQES